MTGHPADFDECGRAVEDRTRPLINPAAPKTPPHFLTS